MAGFSVRKKTLLRIFIVLSAINLIIFLFKDHFVYNEYASYNSLYSACNESCINKWGQYARDFPKQELIKATTFLDSTIGTGNESMYITIEKVGRLLYNNFNKQLGNPVNHSFVSPLQEYRFFITHKDEQLWCGHFADMFAFFCWAKGIPCRTVEIMNPGDHHVLNECYDDKNDKWVMVDVTNNQLLTQDETHRYLNLLDFRKSLAASSKLTVLRATDSGSIYLPLKDTTAYLETYYKKDRPLFFITARSLKRFMPRRISSYGIFYHSPGIPFMIRSNIPIFYFM